MDLKTATVKVGDLNTIAAPTFHINYYIAGVLQLLQGGKLEIRDQFSFDLPLIKTQSDWERLRAQLWNNAGLFALALERVNAEDFGAPFVDPQVRNLRAQHKRHDRACILPFGAIGID